MPPASAPNTPLFHTLRLCLYEPLPTLHPYPKIPKSQLKLYFSHEALADGLGFPYQTMA